MTSRMLTGLLLLACSAGATAQAPVTLKSAVVVLSDDPVLRQQVEDALVVKAREHDYDAVASHTIVPDIADADSRLGPVLEAVINGRYGWVPFSSLARVAIEPPEDLRDLVWVPAHLWFAGGGETVALVPSRYVGSGAAADGALRLSRKTEWLPIGPDQYQGMGQRLLTTSASEQGLLQVREIVLHGDAAGAAAA